MNKDQVKGRVKEVAGKVQRKTGNAAADDDTAARGTLKEAEGKIQKTFGDAKSKIAKNIDK